MAQEDVLIVCEAGKGQTASANARLIAEGAVLAGHWGGRLVGVLAGHGVEAEIADIGPFVDELRAADAPLHANYDAEVHLQLVQDLVAELQPRAVLFGHTYVGMDLAPRLAAKLKVGAAANCFGVTIEEGEVRFMRPMYRGRVHAKVAMDRTPMIATLQTGGAQSAPAPREGVVKRIAAAAPQAAKCRPVRTLEPSRDGVDIAKADIVVAGGRGIGERENFGLVSDLAEALGGVPACSRPLVDMGWFGTDYQVGLSGNTVKPKLYVACGISGAVEHVQGMKESEVVVAINKDPDAPIFKFADYGVVGDLHEILPALTREIRALKAGKPPAK